MIPTMDALSAAPDRYTSLWPNPRSLRRLLAAAAIFHLVVTISVYALGRAAAVPATFDANGIAISFAPDGIKLREEAAKLGDSLARGQIRDWFLANSPLHIKLYSICFALLGPWFGSTILSAEPLNALCYLGILVLIFNLGQEVFNRRAGLIAAAIVALWPTFLLHTTQLLKDPLFLVGMLALILVNLRLLSRSFSWAGALLTGALGGSITLFLWLVRGSMGELMIATLALAAAMLVVRQLREKRFQAANLVGMALLIVLSAGVTQVVPRFQQPDAPQDTIETAGQDNTATRSPTFPGGVKTARLKKSKAAPPNPWSLMVARVGQKRQQFVIAYPNASANLDSNVQLNSTADIVRYLPRAAAIGFFSPFPDMWFATGSHVGSAGRLLSGVETMAMYLVEGLAIFGLWNKDRCARGRWRFSVWFLWLVAAMGMISLGLVVVNVGTLFRLRYVFLILLIILAAEAATQTLDWFRKRRSSDGGLLSVPPPVADGVD